MATLPIILTVEGMAAVQTAMKGVAGAAQRTGATIGKATQKGYKQANLAGQRFKKAMTADSTLAGGAASLGLRMFTDNLITAGDEAASSSLKLDALLAKRDPGARRMLDELSQKMAHVTGFDDDLFTEAQARMISFGVSGKEITELMDGMTGQSETMGDGMGGVLANAEAVGKALNNINAGALTRQGTTLNPEDVKAVNALKESGDMSGARALLYDKIKESFAKYAVNAGSSMSEAQKQRGRFTTQKGNVGEALGQGAGEMRAIWQGALTSPLAKIATDLGALKAAGAGLEIGTQLAPVFTGMAVIGQSLPAWNLLGKSKIATMIWGTVTALNAETISRGFATAKTWASVKSLGPMGMLGALGLVAVAAYGVYETMEGLKNATTLSDEDLKKKGPMGEFHAEAGHKMAWLYGGENEDTESEKKSKAIFASMGKKKKSGLKNLQAAQAGASKVKGGLASIGAGGKATVAPGGGSGSELQDVKDRMAARRFAKIKDADARADAIKLYELQQQEKAGKAGTAAKKLADAANSRAMAKRSADAEREGKARQKDERDSRLQALSDQKATALLAIKEQRDAALARTAKGDSWSRNAINANALRQSQSVNSNYQTTARNLRRGQQATVRVFVPENPMSRSVGAY